MLIKSAAQTDIGLVRSENEDRLLCADDLGLYAVADGIGGLPGGAEAAEVAIKRLLESARAFVARGETVRLDTGIQEAHRAVLELAALLAPDTGLGTTLCAALIHEGGLHIANVGDSRCYLYRGGRLRLLTVDDTVENEVLMRRAKGEQVHLEERYRNALTRCLGQPMDLDISILSQPLEAGDTVLVCSDGITRILEESAIARRLNQPLAPDALVAALINDALACGGYDNATGVVLRIESL